MAEPGATADSAREAGRQALAALEHALSQKPNRDGEAFSEATESLCRMRDGLTGSLHQADVNAVISAVLAGYFPIGATPWPQVESAAESLRRILARD